MAVWPALVRTKCDELANRWRGRRRAAAGGPHGRPAATGHCYLSRVENVSEPSAPLACSSRFAAKSGWNEVPAVSSAW
jgi:hypothetical protein